MRLKLCLLGAFFMAGCATATNGAGPTQTGNSASGEVDVSNLTMRERSDYHDLVRSLLAPCPELPESIAECVEHRSACNTCLPAALFLRDAISHGRTTVQAEVAFRTRFDPKSVNKLDVAGSPVKGDPNAPVTIVEWADFECPFCARASTFIDELLKTRSGKVRLVFKYYPLSGHPHGELTACAAAAADLQGKFWPMHDQLFANQSAGLDESKIREIAKAIGLDLPRFEKDWNSEEIRQKVEADRNQAERLGLQGTPFVWVNGRHFDSKSFSLEEDLPNWLDLEWTLQNSGKPKP